MSFKFRLDDVSGYEQTAGSYDLTDSGLWRVLFLDYDFFKMPLSFLEKQLETLQKIYRLSDFHIFKTGETSFHVINFELFTSKEIEEIGNKTSADDMHLQNFMYDYTPKILRILPKSKHKPSPKLIKVIKSKYNLRKKSGGHIKVYESILGITIPNKKKMIKTGLWGIGYETKRGLN